MSDELTLLISEKSNQRTQILALLTTTFLAIGCGFQNGWPSPSIPRLLSNDLGFEVTEEQISYIVMLAPMGFVIGCPLAGFLLDRVGRKYTLVLLSIPEVLSCVFIASSNNVNVLYVARLLTGIANGALFTSLPMYTAEISEKKYKRLEEISLPFGIHLGILLINVYGSYLNIRTAAVVSLSFPLIVPIMFIWMPQSPYYLIMKDRFEDARCSLKILGHLQNVDEELSKITLDVQKHSESSTFKNVFSTDHLNGFLIVVGLQALQQFSGLYAFCFYMQMIFGEVGDESALSPRESAIICCCVQVLFMSYSYFLMDLLGRKSLLYFSSAGSAIMLFVMGFYFIFQENSYGLSSVTWIPISGMVLYSMVNGFGLVMLPSVVSGEILSTSVKSEVLCVLNMYLGVCLGAASKLFQCLQHDFGMHVPFFVFGACCIMGIVFIYLCVPETERSR